MSDPERFLKTLDPLFAAECRKVLMACQDHGHQLRPFFGARDIQTQARLYRQSRGWPEIEQTIVWLREQGAPFLAETLNGVGAQHGRWATNALPGQSWHQWGKALDCFVLVDGAAIWDGDHPGYAVYAEEAERVGLTAGARWERSPDSVHIQQPPQSVSATMRWDEIDAAMRTAFGPAMRGA